MQDSPSPEITQIPGQLDALRLNQDQTALFLNESVDIYEQTVSSWAGAGLQMEFSDKRGGTHTRMQFFRSHIVWFATVVLSVAIVGLATWDMPSDAAVEVALNAMAFMSAADLAKSYQEYAFG